MTNGKIILTYILLVDASCKNYNLYVLTKLEIIVLENERNEW